MTRVGSFEPRLSPLDFFYLSYTQLFLIPKALRITELTQSLVKGLPPRPQVPRTGGTQVMSLV